MELNPQQQQVVSAREPSLLVSAGAGSGKTTAIAERFLSLVDEGVGVENILVVTFTKKAAKEMLDRIRRSLIRMDHAEEARQLEHAYISTIDGFCARVLRAHPFAAGLGGGFGVMEQLEADICQAEAFREALEVFLAGHGNEVDDFLTSYTLLSRSQGSNDSSLETNICRLHAKLRSQGQDGEELPPVADVDITRSLDQVLQAIRDTLVIARDDASKTGEKAAASLQELDELLSGWAGGGVDMTGLLPKPAVDARGRLNGPIYRSFKEDAWSAFETAYYSFRAADHIKYITELLRLFAQRYRAAKERREALDFTDLGLLTLKVFTEHPRIADAYRQRFREIMIDEFQDTNRLQQRIMERIAGDSVFRVGDEKQSIYRFRDADVSIIQRLRGGLPPAAVKPLTVNYRSRPEILNFINSVFQRDALMGASYEALQAGIRPEVTTAPIELCLIDPNAKAEDSRRTEARWIAERVAALVNDEGFMPGDITLLCSAASNFDIYEAALLQTGLATFVNNGKGYYELSEIHDTTSMLRLVDNPRDDLAMLTVMRSPLCLAGDDAIYQLSTASHDGRTLWEKLMDLDARSSIAPELSEDKAKLLELRDTIDGLRKRRPTMTLSELVMCIARQSSYDVGLLATGKKHQLANIHKLARLAATFESDFGADLHGFLRLLESAKSTSIPEGAAAMSMEDRNSVRLMSIHAAKGLDLRVVFLIDAGNAKSGGSRPLIITDGETTGLCYKQSGSKDQFPVFNYKRLAEADALADAEEQKRKLYVAMTRAEHKLVISGQPPKATKVNSAAAPTLMEYVAGALPAADIDGADKTVTVDETPVLITRLREIVGPETPPLTRLLPQPEPQANTAGLDLGTFRELPRTAAALRPRLSYSALDTLRKCPAYFYVRHILGLDESTVRETEAGKTLKRLNEELYGAGEEAARHGAAVGSVAHDLLERLDWNRPEIPPTPELLAALRDVDPGIAPEAGERLRAMLTGFLNSRTFHELARQERRYTELRFWYDIAGYQINGDMDLVIPLPGKLLICDYKSNFLGGRSPAEIATDYDLQQAVYALAGLHMLRSPDMLPELSASDLVEVRFIFLERPDEPVSTGYTIADTGTLAEPIEELIDRYLETSDFPLSPGSE